MPSFMCSPHRLSAESAAGARRTAPTPTSYSPAGHGDRGGRQRRGVASRGAAQQAARRRGRVSRQGGWQPRRPTAAARWPRCPRTRGRVTAQSLSSLGAQARGGGATPLVAALAKPGGGYGRQTQATSSEGALAHRRLPSLRRPPVAAARSAATHPTRARPGVAGPPAPMPGSGTEWGGVAGRVAVRTGPHACTLPAGADDLSARPPGLQATLADDRRTSARRGGSRRVAWR